MAPAELRGQHDAHRPLPSTRHLRGSRIIQLVGQARPSHHHALLPPLDNLMRLQYSVEPITSEPLVPIEARENAGVPSADRESRAKGILEHTAAAVLPDCASGRPMFLPRRATVRRRKERTHRRVLNIRRFVLWTTQLGRQQHQQQPQQQQQQQRVPKWLAPRFMTYPSNAVPAGWFPRQRYLKSIVTPWPGDPRTLSMTTPMSLLLTRLGVPKLHKAWRNSRVRLIQSIPHVVLQVPANPY